MNVRSVIFGLVLVSFGACQSFRPRDTEKALETLDELDEEIDESDATPAQKESMKSKTAPVKKIVKDQGDAIVKKDAEIKRLEWYEDIFWQAVIGLSGLALGAGLFWFLKK